LNNAGTDAVYLVAPITVVCEIPKLRLLQWVQLTIFWRCNDDFADSECFQVGSTYRTLPGCPSRQESLEALPWDDMGPIMAGSKITAAFRSRPTPTSWPAGESNGYRLEIDREWQEGLASCVVYSDTSPALETFLAPETPTSSTPGRLTIVGADGEETASEADTASGTTMRGWNSR